MFHLDQDDNLYNGTPVLGQYQRTFTQQCSALTTWSTPRTMANDYERGREAARERDYRKEEYDKAVFATDIDFRNVDYPVKSGYYFNPTGEYTFTVKTVTYKTTRNDTRDHQELVNAFINAFRYESDLIYINDYGDAVNLQNELLPTEGSSYARESAALTAQDPTGVDELVLLNVLDRSDSEARYRKKVEEIQHSEAVDGDTHPYWKDILEGYYESDTIDSKLQYKYREYVQDGQPLYRITEETTVTIEINPENEKVFTHVHMPDGEYTVKAWIEEIDLAKIKQEYKKLGVLRGMASLDEIEVSVKGSMYEDVH
jgi:heat shock protein HspQ